MASRGGYTGRRANRVLSGAWRKGLVLVCRETCAEMRRMAAPVTRCQREINLLGLSKELHGTGC